MLPAPLQELADDLTSFDADMRLEILVDLGKKLPTLPDDLQAKADAGINRVPECMTPVFLFVAQQDNKLSLNIGVGDNSDVVKGLMAILATSLNQQPPKAVAALPNDLLAPLGLKGLISMQRSRGFLAITQRIKQQAKTVSSDD